MKGKVGEQWNKIFMEIFRSMSHGFLLLSPVSLTEFCSFWYAVMPTLPLLAGDLRFFASSPALPLWYITLPLFTSTINIEYLVKNKTDLV